MVMEALKILSQQFSKCRTVYLSRQVKTKNRLLVPCQLDKPNPKCYVCAAKPEVTVYLNPDVVTCRQLEERLFKDRFGMVAPDVEIDDGKGSIIISSEEGETEQNWSKRLSEFNIGNGCRLKADDFLQNYELIVVVRHKNGIEYPELFQVEGDLPQIPSDEKAKVEATPLVIADLASSSPAVVPPSSPRKRKYSTNYDDLLSPSKRRRSECQPHENGVDGRHSEDIIIL